MGSGGSVPDHAAYVTLDRVRAMEVAYACWASLRRLFRLGALRPNIAHCQRLPTWRGLTLPGALC